MNSDTQHALEELMKLGIEVGKATARSEAKDERIAELNADIDTQRTEIEASHVREVELEAANAKQADRFQGLSQSYKGANEQINDMHASHKAEIAKLTAERELGMKTMATLAAGGVKTLIAERDGLRDFADRMAAVLVQSGPQRGTVIAREYLEPRNAALDAKGDDSDG